MNRRPLSSWSAGQRLLGLVAAAALAVGVPAAASAGGKAAIIGNAKAGKPIFVQTCGVCHTLLAAKSVGNIGPNLDRTSLPEATIIKAISYGGSTVMSKAAAAKYYTTMTAYKKVLSTTVIQNVAAFVYSSTHK